ncbi:unnamed protein product [Chironomus riparius]|uniref:Uncharacterized protein n=1 Tax=Chironomus riparius TaxID=315576 RepID=A0A9P0NDD5_9DIPT|nr:unnamed protein product [Chironomus riparius]
MLKVVFVVLCLMLAVVAAYPSEDVVKNDQSVSVERSESAESEEQDLSGAESRYGGFGGFGHGFGGLGHLGGLGGLGFGRGFGKELMIYRGCSLIT